MSRRTLLLYFLAPIGIVLWSIVGLVGQKETSPLDVLALSIQMLIFYPGPYLWWVVLCKLRSLQARYWHAGLIAAFWLLYWPLAVVLQILFAVGCRLISSAIGARTPNTSLERTREG